ncbi:MAG: tRNA lysidine(34) synthetase TilS [Candidatus Weimeria sp.]
MDFTEQTERFIRDSGMLRQKGSVTVGISGGADSVCLFLQLYKLRKRLGIDLKAVTVEHGIRGDESESDAEFSRKFCEERGIPCRIVHVDAPGRAAERGISLEEAARQLRYEAFFDNTDQGETIALAHHLEDQAETVIFHMIRGSGVRGLTGMRPETEVRGRRLIRPLLFATKQEITAELTREGISWRTDSTNSDISYARNRIRAVIIPELLQINAGAVRHICEAADDVGKMYDGFFLKEMEYIASHDTGNGLDCSDLKNTDDYTVGMVIMEYLRQHLRSIKDVGREHIGVLTRLVKKEQNFTYDLPAGARVFFEYGVMRTGWQDVPGGFYFSLEELSDTGSSRVRTEKFSITLEIRGFSSSQIKDIPQKNYEKWLDYDKINKCSCIRSRQAGDYFTIEGGHRQKFKDFCVNEKIPASARDDIPLLVSGEHHILAALGTDRISVDARITEQTKRILVIRVIPSGGK